MILVINCGSSTIKYQLYSTDLETVAAKGAVSRIGEGGSSLKHQAGHQQFSLEADIPTHSEGFELMIQALLHPEHGAIRTIEDIQAVGHRTVHGADIFVESAIVTPEMIEKLNACTPLAPLHNPANLIGIVQAQALLPNVPHVAVFDTSFHQTMPEKAYTYALPYELAHQHKIRRYGFHGTSFRYVSQRAAEMLGRPLAAVKSVVCHLGNGASIAAVDGGKSVDTSLGFATFCGVMMGTRSGDFDPAIIFYLHNEVGMSLADIEKMVFKQSGLLGVSGQSNDMRILEEKATAGDSRSQLAREMFAYMVKKYVGAYAAAMGGIDALVFTAGIGENNQTVRRLVCEGLGFLGIELDEAANMQAIRGKEMAISRPEARTAVLVIPTDEEKMIALDTVALAGIGGER